MQHLSNPLIFSLGTFSLSLGLVLLYKHQWILKFNQWIRELIFNDSVVLLGRRKKATLFLLIGALFFYWGYQREQYCPLHHSDKILSTDLLLYYSLTHLYSKRYHQSKALCQRVLKRDPNNTHALYTLAACQFLTNDVENGTETWSKAVSLDPYSCDAERLKTLIKRFKEPSSPVIPIVQ